jgi:hypothetical protein
MGQFLLVRQIAVAGVEALRQEQQVADPVPIISELAGVRELVLMPFGMVGPGVLDLVAPSRRAWCTRRRATLAPIVSRQTRSCGPAAGGSGGLLVLEERPVGLRLLGASSERLLIEVWDQSPVEPVGIPGTLPQMVAGAWR